MFEVDIDPQASSLKPQTSDVSSPAVLAVWDRAPTANMRLPTPPR